MAIRSDLSDEQHSSPCFIIMTFYRFESFGFIIICVFLSSTILLFYGSAILCALVFTTLHIMWDSSLAFQTIWFLMLYSGDFTRLCINDHASSRGGSTLKSTASSHSFSRARTQVEINDALGEKLRGKFERRKKYISIKTRNCSNVKRNETAAKNGDEKQNH